MGVLKNHNWLSFLFKILADDRGELGDSDDDGTLEVLVEDFDDDELVALGEKEPTGDGDGDGDDSDKGESGSRIGSDQAGGESDEQSNEENKVPQSRFDQVMGEKKTIKEKLDLLRKDPDEYYRQYPDEKPTNGEDPIVSSDTEDIGEFVVTGGPYEGKTINELYSVNPAEATRLVNKYYNDKREAEAQAENDKKAAEQKALDDTNRFADFIASNVLSVPEGQSPNSEQQKQIEGEIQKVLDWMKETGRGYGNYEDAYFLMNKDKLLSDAAARGSSSITDAARRGKVRTVQVGGSDDGGLSGEYDLNASETQLEAMLDAMPQSKYEEWLKNAPQEFKNKFSGLPWD